MSCKLLDPAHVYNLAQDLKENAEKRLAIAEGDVRAAERDGEEYMGTNEPVIGSKLRENLKEALEHLSAVQLGRESVMYGVISSSATKVAHEFEDDVILILTHDIEDRIEGYIDLDTYTPKELGYNPLAKQMEYENINVWLGKDHPIQIRHTQAQSRVETHAGRIAFLNGLIKNIRTHLNLIDAGVENDLFITAKAMNRLHTCIKVYS